MCLKIIKVIIIISHFIHSTSVFRLTDKQLLFLLQDEEAGQSCRGGYNQHLSPAYQYEVLGQTVSIINAAKSPKHETSTEASQLLKTKIETQSCPEHFKQLLFLGLN